METTFDLPANIAFGVIAVAIIVAAIRVVTTRNIVHAALWLVVVLGGVGAIYILLQAEFVAVVQYLVYIGAIVVLFLFGIMLTRAPLGEMLDLTNRTMRVGAIITAVILVTIMVFSVVDSFRDEEVDFIAYSGDVAAAQTFADLSAEEQETVLDEVAAIGAEGTDLGPVGRTETVSDSIFRDYLIPFEVISALLLAALIGAIVIARRD
ncbi:MAG: hypothetical protein JJLCMIEE_00366 [Acidimicrobiales bacterium]|nr:MAG: NADH-quinone oxidoreductase subunit J [Actinomycetota bacterium]MBV6507322.1 hypothetical protein [Acidimicrobiales bacterium]RIK02966.1 MAG: proton-conducting membrane transporter [Acidobacteriota bacterium]